MDICLQVVVNAATHDLSYDPMKESRREKNGDIIYGYLASQAGNVQPDSTYIPKIYPVKSPRTGFIFISGVPTNIVQNIRDRIANPWHNPLDITDDPQVVYNRRYSIPPASIPVALRQEMLSNRYINVTWTQVKNYLQDKGFNRLVVDSDFQ